jgi:hypothetical protein
MVDPLEGNPKMDILMYGNYYYYPTLTLNVFFCQKDIYEKLPEQLSELPPRFYSRGEIKSRWFHPEWPDNTD